jgi:hypothetical protein
VDVEKPFGIEIGVYSIGQRMTHTEDRTKGVGSHAEVCDLSKKF